jgi:sugar phosphate isomerase/epimerase
MGTSPEEMIRLAVEHGWTLEFSSGMPYRPDMEKLFLEAPVRKLAHNYFPAPEIPFVLNLASSDDEIRSRSIEHCINGLILSQKAGAPFFSAHAGFCVDPHPDELGRRLALTNPFDRKAHWKLFIASVKHVAANAQRLGMKFLIENNVLASVNVHPNGSNPLLCCDADEMLQMLKEADHPDLGLLVDTGHLKASSVTLKYDLQAAVKKLEGKVDCIHHSDNDGSFDTNDLMMAEYWFLQHLEKFRDIVHVIEVKRLSSVEIEEQIVLLENTLKHVR